MKKTVVAILLILPFLLIYFVSFTGQILAEISHIDVERLEVLDKNDNPMKDNAILLLNVNQEMELSIHIYPERASNKEVLITSSNEDVVEVLQDNKLKAKAEGEAQITVSSKDQPRIKRLLEVVVVDNNIYDITLDYTTLELTKGNEFTVHATLQANGADLESTRLKWTSEDVNVAAIRPSGSACTIVAKGEGETTIRVALENNPDVFQDITVTVTADRLPGIYFNDNDQLLVVSENQIDLKALVDIVDLEISAEDLVFTLKSYYELDEELFAQGILKFNETDTDSPIITIDVKYGNYSDTLRIKFKPQS